MKSRWLVGAIAVSATLVAGGAYSVVPALAGAPAAGSNVRVTVDKGSTYVSADQLSGGSYSDGVLARCGVDRRPQNEPTLAIDPRNHGIWAAGANDYCTVPTAGDAWAGFYRSTNSGATWTDSLLPGYSGDQSAQGMSSPLAALVAGGALAAGDPQMSWDGRGDLFYMGNNFNRGTDNGASGLTKDNIGSIWVATYSPAPHATGTSSDGSHYVRTALLAQNTFGLGAQNDKTDLVVDPATGNVYAAWSNFHGGGCNVIMFSRSTDHGATFSAPVKISSGICGNQGPSIAVGRNGHVFVAWEGNTGGALEKTPGAVNGAAFVSSPNFGQTFGKARLALTYTTFISEQFSGNGARECGDAPFNCPTGQTFPRFDLAGPSLAADNTHGTLVMAFPVAQPNGQGQIEYVVSSDGGSSWSTPKLLAPARTGHQFFPWVTAANGVVSAGWEDSRGDPNYSPTRAPCNSATGATSACLNVRYAQSTDGGKTWGASIRVTNKPTNPNYEQFGGRLVPFFGDYITVAAAPRTATQSEAIGVVWTDQRNTVGADDPAGDNDGADVAGDPETGGACTSSLDTCFDHTGGLDQNIYAAAITP
jgi:hypothetical protein